MVRTITMICGVVLAGLAAEAVSAKSLSRIIASTGLAPEDFNIMKATARSMYDRPNPQQGRIVSWTRCGAGNASAAK